MNHNKSRKLIYVFCEGEGSEPAYIRFLSKEFKKSATIKPPIHGLFDIAKRKFKNEAKFKNSIDVIDEIWFFFDVDANTATDGSERTWDKYSKIMNWLSNKKKTPKIKIRLLMTTGCIEYWFLLHYKKIKPPITSPADKDKVMKMLQREEPRYTKTDENVIGYIAKKRFHTAIANGKWTLDSLCGLPDSANLDRDHWLYTCGQTFTTVHEAVEYLLSL